jgi:hypothetical protein
MPWRYKVDWGSTCLDLCTNAEEDSGQLHTPASLLFSDSFTWTIIQNSHQASDTSTTRFKLTQKVHSMLPTEVISILPTQILFLNFLVFPLFCPPLYMLAWDKRKLGERWIWKEPEGNGCDLIQVIPRCLTGRNGGDMGILSKRTISDGQAWIL